MTHNTSSESEDSPRSRPADLKKRKKKKPLLSPQTSINNTWRRFSNPRPQQALSILPLDQATRPSSNSSHGNELLSNGRLRAVAECRRKVNEIVDECKQVNMRYRDPDWDLVSIYDTLRAQDWLLIVDRLSRCGTSLTKATV
jgi:hypothetical protein